MRVFFKNIGIVAALTMSLPVLALTPVELKEQQLGIDFYLEASSLEYTPPSWFQPVHHSLAPEEASYRINEVLPFPEDRYESMYLVIPALGAVTPIKQIPLGSNDFTLMSNGKDIAINTYLQGGIIEYVSSAAPGYRGKRIDFGHSNYFKTDTGRYKTIFANLMALDVNDQVRYYVRHTNGSYELFKYTITASYPTNPSNVQALQRDGDGADALIFGCYHGLDGRWMIEATYTGDPLGVPLGEDSRFDAIPLALQKRIFAALKKIAFLEDRVQAYQLLTFFNKLGAMRLAIEASGDVYKTQVLDFIEEQIALLYPEGV